MRYSTDVIEGDGSREARRRNEAGDLAGAGLPERGNPGRPAVRAGRRLADVTIRRMVVTTQDDAERLGMTGSPTLLADGADLFARPGQMPAISCRLYRDEHGRPGPAPSLGQLPTALRLNGRHSQL